MQKLLVLALLVLAGCATPAPPQVANSDNPPPAPGIPAPAYNSVAPRSSTRGQPYLPNYCAHIRATGAFYAWVNGL